MKKITLNDTYDFKDNSFSFIRLISALTVMLGHYFTYAEKPLSCIRSTVSWSLIRLYHL